MPRSDGSMQLDEDEFSSMPTMIAPPDISMSMFSGRKMLQITSTSDAIRQLEPSMQTTPMSQGDRGIDPSLLINEASPTPNSMNTQCESDADLQLRPSKETTPVSQDEGNNTSVHCILQMPPHPQRMLALLHLRRWCWHHLDLSQSS